MKNPSNCPRQQKEGIAVHANTCKTQPSSKELKSLLKLSIIYKNDLQGAFQKEGMDLC
jgi:hypothetical protein